MELQLPQHHNGTGVFVGLNDPVGLRPATRMEKDVERGGDSRTGVTLEIRDVK